VLERQEIGPDLVRITSNEPFAELEVILDVASKDDSHPLHQNYTNIRLSDYLYVNVITLKGVPTVFYGLQQKQWMGDAARAYTRVYRVPSQRGLVADSCYIVMAGYHTQTKWWEPFTDTLFVTRNVDDKKDTLMQISMASERRRVDNTTLLGRASLAWKEHWKPYPYTCNINGVEQLVLTMGGNNLDFLQPLHIREYKHRGIV
jgi:hypothetical protein